MPNRLAGETSPYLLQHKDNPVDWYPWGDEAFAKAKAENKPIFLSVGYSSCHWCHVMAHESFEDLGVAELLNRHFVSVKLDREERPDLDEAYMTAVQISSGRGGWPMSVFLTPDRKPFFAGTYFPKENRAGHPGFKTILSQLASAWATKRKDLLDAGEEFAKAIEEVLTKPAPATFTKLDAALIDNAVRAAASHFDREHGGSVGAPKFPPHSELDFLLSFVMKEDAADEMKEPALAMALLTLEKICLGGIHDHAGGGFHRYAVDEVWVLPHFEKMLSDNALMLSNLARGAAVAAQLDERLYRLFYRSLIGIASWVIREMRSEDGLFFSAQDADSEGEEGLFYVWAEEEVDQVLGPRSAPFKAAFNVTTEGNYMDESTRERTGRNILYLTEGDGLEHAVDLASLEKVRSATRVRPGLDDKSLVAWNALMVTALVESGVGVEYAEATALKILAAENELGSLPHQIAQGKPSGPAFLDDYAYFVQALLVLSDLMADVESGAIERPSGGSGQRSSSQWRSDAQRLAGEMIRRFYDVQAGGFFYTEEKQENLFGRSKPAFDHPLPSPNAVAIRCLAAIGDHERASKSLSAFLGWMERAPTSTMALHAAALQLGTMPMVAPEVPSRPLQTDATAPARQVGREVIVSLAPKEMRADASGVGHGSVTLIVPEGLHLNSSAPPARWLIPTRVEIGPLHAQVEYPNAVNDRYEGEVEIPFSVTLPPGEAGADFEVRVEFQACTESECLPAQEKVLTAVVLR